jgi:hypothetical protein
MGEFDVKLAKLKLGLYRSAAIAIELAQSVVAALGGGNGDPGDIRKSERKSQ